jgi:hypothetical protein
MKLKSFGCSFIFGSELSDDRSNGENLVPSNLAWPALVAQHLNYEYKTFARPGSGNLQIAEQVLTQAAKDDPGLFVIGWTWVDRYDHWDSARFKWNTILPNDSGELAKTYYRDLHSEYRDKLTTLMTVRLVIDVLLQKQIPFIMTYMDDLMFDQQWHSNAVTKELQAYIQPYMTTFEGKTFLNWSRDNGYPESALWHPLDEAHRVASDYVLDIWEKQQ